MFYFRGQNFDEQVAESRRKHVPLFFGVEAYADSASNYYPEGKLHLWMTAGELNKCRKVDMDPAMMKKMGVGHVYRYSSKDDKTGTNTRYMFKLWYQPTRGFIAENPIKGAPKTSHVFDVPEDMFVKWIQPDPEEAYA